MKVAGKLTALLGLPLLVIFAIFASGVYCGATRADQVVELEQRWLGIAPPEGRLLDPAAADAGSAEEQSGAGDTPDEPAPAPQPTEQSQPVEQAEPSKPVEPSEQAQPSEQPEQSSNKAPVSALEPAKAEPVGAELRSRFDEPKVVRVKLMIDPALVVAREDWLGYLADLFEATRVSYERLFGIELQLHGVVVWDDAVGADTAALLTDLAQRNRDGADLILGLLARARPSDFTAARWTADVTGDHALVFADLQQPDRYYRNMLRALALLFGAEPALDAESKQLGSFMSDGGTVSGAPVIDPDNRGKVIINKRRPIAAPPSVEPDPAVEPEQAPEQAPAEDQSEI